jgi:hypothetical protein
VSSSVLYLASFGNFLVWVVWILAAVNGALEKARDLAAMKWFPPGATIGILGDKCPATEPVVMSEAELNAFISRNLDVRDLPFDRPMVFLHDGNGVDILGQIPLGRLLAESPFGAAAELVPTRWTSHPVWLQMWAHAQFEPGPRRQLRLDVRRVAVGQQRLPALALRVILDPARLRFLRMPLPDTVADVRIQTGRIVIRPTSSRRRT